MTNTLRELRVREANRFCETPVYKELTKRLVEFHEHAEDCLAGGGSRRRSFIVLGESGTGKTTALAQAFSRIEGFRAAENGEDRNLISILVPSPCSGKDLAIRMLEEIGLPASRKANEHELFHTLKKQLRARGILFIHLDEAQDLLTARTPHAVRELQDRLKSLLSIPDWPVHLILSGVPELANILVGDPQFANRAVVMRFGVVKDGDKKIVISQLEDIAVKHCGLSLDGELLQDNFVERLVAANRGCLGSIIEMIRAACFATLARERQEVTPRDFQVLYARLSGSLTRDNIMTSPHWRDLDRQNALADMLPPASKPKAAKSRN